MLIANVNHAYSRAECVFPNNKRRKHANLKVIGFIHHQATLVRGVTTYDEHEAIIIEAIDVVACKRLAVECNDNEFSHMLGTDVPHSAP